MRLRNYLEDMITESIEDKGIFKSCFFSGFPGAGKSYVLKKIKSGTIDPRVVNTDKVTEFFGGGSNVDWEVYGAKIKQLTANQLINYINSLLPLFIDGTSSNSPALFRRVGILKSLGYDVSMVWINTSLETALERNRNRQRYVDEEFIRGVYEKVEKIKPYYKSEFGSKFLEVDNDIGELTNDVVLKAYKQVEKFFLSPIQNPIGQELKQEMVDNGWKYLYEHPEYDIQYIKKLINSWYKK